MRTADPTLDWQRTSPVALVFFLARSARQIIGNALPALAGLLAWFSIDTAGSGSKEITLGGMPSRLQMHCAKPY